MVVARKGGDGNAARKRRNRAEQQRVDTPISRPPPPSTPPPVTQPRNGDVRPSAVEVLRGVEETQRRSVAALKAMVELLIEKGVFSREEYLSRVKSR